MTAPTIGAASWNQSSFGIRMVIAGFHVCFPLLAGFEDFESRLVDRNRGWWSRLMLLYFVGSSSVAQWHVG